MQALQENVDLCKREEGSFTAAGAKDFVYQTIKNTLKIALVFLSQNYGYYISSRCDNNLFLRHYFNRSFFMCIAGIERLLRDGKAGWMMGASNEVLRQLVGKTSLLGLAAADLW